MAEAALDIATDSDGSTYIIECRNQTDPNAAGVDGTAKPNDVNNIMNIERSGEAAPFPDGLIDGKIEVGDCNTKTAERSGEAAMVLSGGDNKLNSEGGDKVSRSGTPPPTSSPLSDDSGRNKTVTSSSKNDDARIVIIFGRKGSGKKTIARSMFPDIAVISENEAAQRDTDNTMITEMKSLCSGDMAILVNLEPSLVSWRRRQVIQKFKRYFESLQSKLNSSQCFVYLLVFVFRRGCFTYEDRDMWDYVLSCLTTESYAIKSRMALVITCCDDLSSEAQENVIQNFKINRATKRIADFMEADIICVGFPNIEEVIDTLRDSYKQVIQESKEKLNTLLEKAVSVIESRVKIDTIFYVPNVVFDTGKFILFQW